MGESLRKQVSCPRCGESFWVFGKSVRSSSCPHCGVVIGFDPESGGVLFTEEAIDYLSPLNYEQAEQLVLGDPEAVREMVDVSEIDVDVRVLGLVPESVARENCVLPIDVDQDSITVVMPIDQWPCELLIEKLEFILGHKIIVKLTSRGSILTAIDRFYTE